MKPPNTLEYLITLRDFELPDRLLRLDQIIGRMALKDSGQLKLWEDDNEVEVMR